MRILVFKPQNGVRDVLLRPAVSKMLPPVVLRGLAKGDVKQAVMDQLDAYASAEQAALVAKAGL